MYEDLYSDHLYSDYQISCRTTHYTYLMPVVSQVLPTEDYPKSVVPECISSTAKRSTVQYSTVQ